MNNTEKQKLTPGYIGLSTDEEGNDQAIAWAGDDNFFFFLVDPETGWDLEEWNHKQGSDRSLFDLACLLHDWDPQDVSMMFSGSFDDVSDEEFYEAIN